MLAGSTQRTPGKACATWWINSFRLCCTAACISSAINVLVIVPLLFHGAYTYELNVENLHPIRVITIEDLSNGFMQLRRNIELKLLHRGIDFQTIFIATARPVRLRPIIRFTAPGSPPLA